MITWYQVMLVQFAAQTVRYSAEALKLFSFDLCI